MALRQQNGWQELRKALNGKIPSLNQRGDFGGSAGIRTQDPYIKSVLLYQLSYRTDYFCCFTTAVCHRFCGCKSTTLF